MVYETQINLNTKEDLKLCNWKEEVEEIDRLIQLVSERREKRKVLDLKENENSKKENIPIIKKEVGLKDWKVKQWKNPTIDVEFETNKKKIIKRERQIEIGKNTFEYKKYINLVDKKIRKNTDPKTPEKRQKCSTRSWQSQMNIWRRKLHLYDDFEKNTKQNFSFSVQNTPLRQNNKQKIKDIVFVYSDPTENIFL